jgi:hypothetical protein
VSIDEDVFDLRPSIKQVPTSDHDVSDLPRFKRAELVGDAENLSG